jgi:hypothetical protein
LNLYLVCEWGGGWLHFGNSKSLNKYGVRSAQNFCRSVAEKEEEEAIKYLLQPQMIRRGRRKCGDTRVNMRGTREAKVVIMGFFGRNELPPPGGGTRYIA